MTSHNFHTTNTFDYEQFLIDESSDDIDEQMMAMLLEEGKRRGESSSRRPRRYFEREREVGEERLLRDYFVDNPVYPADIFRLRFRMRRELFLRIVEAVKNHNPFFQQRCNAHGRMGLSTLQKCTAAIRQLAYGAPPDSYDEYLRIAETTAVESLFKFCRSLIEVFGSYYLRRPTAEDVQNILQMHQDKHGFPGMLGSLDCMHWQWRNCPVAWKGQFTRGDHGVPTIMLEAVAAHNLWIWHAFFGVAGSNNDINVLHQSPLFNDVLQGIAPPIEFTVNLSEYKYGYYLADGIYPEWVTLVKSFPHPEDPKRQKFKKMHESARKDVERAFGVLQSRWAILRGPVRFWHKGSLHDIMYACIILHNMIIEDEGNASTQWMDNEAVPTMPPTQGVAPQYHRHIQRQIEVRDKDMHQKLRTDLMEHIWEQFGDYDSE